MEKIKFNEFQNIELLERKYFSKICSCLDQSSPKIIKQLSLINQIKDHWLEIAFKKKTNIIDKFAERVIRQELLRGLNWDYLGIPISSDECFILKNAIIHIDVKTQLATERFDVKNPNSINEKKEFEFKNLIASQNQITLLPKNKIKFKKGVGGFISWEPHLPTYYHIDNKRLPCLTYFIRLVYSPSCPKCGLIQDIGPDGQKRIREFLGISKMGILVCVPFGKKGYSQEKTCKTLYSYPSYRLEEVVVYSVPNGLLAEEFYNTNWFQEGMPYKSPVKEGGKIIGIGSARIILESFTKPTIMPPWWKNKSWNRTYKTKIPPTVIISGKIII